MTRERPVRILLVEDNPGDARLIRELLREAGSLAFELVHVERLSAARQRVEGERWDVALVDLSLPDAQGLASVEEVLALEPLLPLIVLTGLDDEAIALRAVQAGAQDYLVKGRVDGQLLGRTIRYARERAEVRRREREARATAEAALRARDEILAVVSHDLGNALAGILVASRVLLRKLPPGDGARGEVENVRILAEQMQRLRRDLLDSAALDAGRLSFAPEAVSPPEVLERAVARHRAEAEEKSLRLHARVDPETPPVLADEPRLEQVLDNLLSNAIRLTPAGGEIWLTAGGSPGEVRFEVVDTGPGIREDDLPRIFDRFWSTKADNPFGAGLGLSIARGIVEAHGGRIWAENRPGGRGAVFRFTIPVAP